MPRTNTSLMEYGAQTLEECQVLQGRPGILLPCHTNIQRRLGLIWELGTVAQSKPSSKP